MFLHVEEHEALQEHKKAPGRADQTSRRSLHAFAAIVPRRFLTEQDVTLGPGHDSSESKPKLRARATAWTRVCTPSFEKILLTWRLTVSIASTSV